MTEDTSQRNHTEQLPEFGGDPGPGRGPVERGGHLLRHLASGFMTKVIILVVVLLVGAYVLVAKLEDLNPFGSRTTISSTTVLGQLTKIEQVHVATRTYPVDVTITQSVGVIPCFLICNQMELKGSGSDDAVLNLNALSRQDVSIDQSTKTVTVRLAAPVIGPAMLNPATCSISSSHGVINSVTQAFKNDPNGYRPLYTTAENRIHAAATHDQALLAAGEQSTRALLTRILGTVGVKKVTVDFS